MTESMGKKDTAVLYGEVVARCWEDEAYKKHFVEDPESVLEEAGIQLEEGIAYKVIEAPKLVQYMVLPAEGVMDAVQKLGKFMLAKADQTDKILPPGTELRIIQNTEDTHYLILPASPKSLSGEDFKAVAGGADFDLSAIPGPVVLIGGEPLLVIGSDLPPGWQPPDVTMLGGIISVM